MTDHFALGRRSTVKRQGSLVDIFKVQDYELAAMFSSGISGDKVENLQRTLKAVLSEPDTGIIGDEADLNRRKTLFKKNQKPKADMPPFMDSVKDAMNDRITILTAGMAVLSIFTGMIYNWKTGWIEGVMILVALLLQILITACNDSAKDTQFVKLQSLAQNEELPVIRGKAGAYQTLNIWDLVVGDIVILQAGDKAPADCLFVEAINVTVDESHVTGDEASERVQKEKGDTVFADSFILSGTAKVLVCAVGTNSTRGKTEFDTRDQTTPLSTKLERIGGSIRFFGLLASITILIIAMVMLLCTAHTAEEGKGFSTFLKRFVENLTLALIVLIVVIPEGIAMTIGVSLAYSVIYMYDKDHILVRDLNSPEKLGLVNEICLGKTGTMTTEEMKVVSFYIQNAYHPNNRPDTLLSCFITDEILGKLYESIVFNSSAYIEMNENSFYVPTGQGTEVSLFKWLQGADIPVHEVIMRKAGRVLFTMPFDNTLKYSLIAVQHPTLEDTVRVYVKGAPEAVMGFCSFSYDAQGNRVPMEDELSTVPELVRNKMTTKGHRVMGFAVKDISLDEWEDQLQSGDYASNLSFLGIVGLHDPLRPGIKDKIAEVQKQQIQIRLISGDDIDTCRTIAYDTGLLTEEEYKDYETGYVMDGATFREQTGSVVTETDEDGVEQYIVRNQQAFDQIMDNLKVLGRATPEDKLIMMVGLKNSDRKVAVVGEGINDVQAFSQASVSFAMGSGSSLARNRASMVLTTNDFESVVRAVMWGRNIYSNMQRFLTFQMTCNISIVLTLFVGTIWMFELPLNAVQLIWINLIMDIFGALALASTRPTTEGSRATIKEDRLMEPHLYRSIYGNALWSLLMMILVIFAGQAMYGLDYAHSVQTTCDTTPECAIEAEQKKFHYTIIFNSFVFLQFWSMLNAREVDPKKMNPFANLFSNWMLLVVLAFIFAFQWCVCFFKISALFDMSLMTESQHFVSGIALGATILVSNILLKFLPANIAAKLPVLDEDKSFGADNKLMMAYEQQAAAKVLPRPGQQKTTTPAAGGDSDGYTQLDP